MLVRNNSTASEKLNPLRSNMSTTAKLAVIGCGGLAQSQHIPIYSSLITLNFPLFVIYLKKTLMKLAIIMGLSTAVRITGKC